MKRLLPLLAVLLLVLTAVAALVIVDRRFDRKITAVSPVTLIGPTCVQPRTIDDFAVYWNQFQIALNDHDKSKLFSMMDTCTFYWDVLYEKEWLRQPVASLDYTPYQNPAGTDTLIRGARRGSNLVFETEDDFLDNYDVIFSAIITRHLLGDTPAAARDGRFEIRWRLKDGLRTLSFDRLPNAGYKFTGLQWEP